MAAVRGIEKNAKVGEGKTSYKGVLDMDVKDAIGEAMVKSGLAIFPVNIDEEVEVRTWTDQDNKPKQQVMVKVKTTYMLAHESGEWVEIVGYGHGVDSQDKAAGKATTYALKYALLYQFMVATGKIDDADNTHSDDIPKTPAASAKKTQKPVEFGIDDPDQSIEKALDYIGKATEIKHLTQIWTGYPKLQGNADFSAALTKKKEILKKN